MTLSNYSHSESLNLRRILLKVLSVILLLSHSLLLGKEHITDGSSGDVQAKINSAAHGDTILLPPGLFSWSSGVNTNGKHITIRGAGAGRVVARSNSTITVGTGTKVLLLTDEFVASIAALRSRITTGASIQVWRTGGAISGGSPTGQVPWMKGTVTSLVGNTLTINVTETNGSGTHPLWIVALDARTTIQSNAPSTTLITLAESDQGITSLSGIRFQHQPGFQTSGNNAAHFVRIHHANNGQPVRVHDCMFVSYTYGSQIVTNSNRGVIWSNSFLSLPFSQGHLAVHASAPALTNSWTTPSTIGSADLTGKSNIYIEDCDFHAWLNATDFDDNVRTTMRHCLFNNAGFGTHGADSSNVGLRHFEVYNSEFIRNNYSDGQTLNVNWYFLIRGGTGVIADNILHAFSGSDYGSGDSVRLALWNLQWNAGPNPFWGSNLEGVQYPAPRQIGRGYIDGNGRDGTGRTNDKVTFVGDLEPLYIWGNSGGYRIGISAFSPPLAGQDRIEDYVVAGRDYYHSGTPRPGYSKYSYPHPLRINDSGPSEQPGTSPDDPPRNASIQINLN